MTHSAYFREGLRFNANICFPYEDLWMDCMEKQHLYSDKLDKILVGLQSNHWPWHFPVLKKKQKNINNMVSHQDVHMDMKPQIITT